MIVDAHAHFGVVLGQRISGDRFVNIMDRYGISMSCVSSMEAFFHCSEHGNDVVLDLMRQYPERIIGFCVPNPHREPLKEIQRCLKAGFRGIKLHPWYFRCPLTSSCYMPIFEEAAARDIPVLFHTGGTLKIPDFKYASLQMVFSVAKQFPEVNLIMGHMGLERWQEVVEQAVPFKNLYLDIAMSMPHPDRVERAVRAVGAHRVIFGTDMPLLDPAISLGLVQGSTLNKREKELILGGNILCLLRIKG